MPTIAASDTVVGLGATGGGVSDFGLTTCGLVAKGGTVGLGATGGGVLIAPVPWPGGLGGKLGACPQSKYEVSPFAPLTTRQPDLPISEYEANRGGGGGGVAEAAAPANPLALLPRTGGGGGAYGGGGGIAAAKLLTPTPCLGAGAGTTKSVGTERAPASPRTCAPPAPGDPPTAPGCTLEGAALAFLEKPRGNHALKLTALSVGRLGIFMVYSLFGTSTDSFCKSAAAVRAGIHPYLNAWSHCFFSGVA